MLSLEFSYLDPTSDNEYLIRGSAGDTVFDGGELVYAGRWEGHVAPIDSVDVEVIGDTMTEGITGTYNTKVTLKNWKSPETQ